MIFTITKKIIFLFLIIITSNVYGDDDNSNRIEILVNENIITKYDIVQRMKLNSILKRVEIDENNYNQIINIITDDLIVEKLKIEKIDEYGINFDKDEFDAHEKRFYSSLNYEKNVIEELLSINSVNFNNLLELIEVDLQWQKLIYGLYLRVSSVTEQEIFDLISKNPDIKEEDAYDLILQKQLDLKSIKLINDLKNEATIEFK